MIGGKESVDGHLCTGGEWGDASRLSLSSLTSSRQTAHDGVDEKRQARSMVGRLTVADLLCTGGG